MVSAIIQLLAAMFRAFPSFKELVECGLDMAAAANVAEAETPNESAGAVE